MNPESSGGSQVPVHGTFQDSVCGLIKQLVDHSNFLPPTKAREKVKEIRKEKELHMFLYNTLLMYRKDDSEGNQADVSLKESVIDKLADLSYALYQERKFDDVHTLETNLQYFEESGLVKDSGAEVLLVLRLLWALKGQGIMQKKSLSEITPKIVDAKGTLSHLPKSSPWHYGDTNYHLYEHNHYYTHFPSSVFNFNDPLIDESIQDNSDQFVPHSLYALNSDIFRSLPGIGITPLLMTKDNASKSGLGAFCSHQNNGLNMSAKLKIPRIQTHILDKTFRSAIQNVSQEKFGCKSKSAYNNMSTSNTKDRDIWEKVAKEPYMKPNKTWESLVQFEPDNQLPQNVDDFALRVWKKYQFLWTSLGSVRNTDKLLIRSEEKLCEDVIHLLVGIPSHSFIWDEGKNSFYLKEGFALISLSPDSLQTVLAEYIQCGTFVRSLESLCESAVNNDNNKQGQIIQSFLVSLRKFLQMHRACVMKLFNEKRLLPLQSKSRVILRRVKFLAKVCEIGNDLKNPKSIPQGIALLGHLCNWLMLTQEPDCLQVLVGFLKDTSVPLFRYIESWIYEGSLTDFAQEYMIECNVLALKQRDRSYVKEGHTLRDLSTMPAFLHDIIKDVFLCGKALNFLKLCSPKHHLVMDGARQHPELNLCLSIDELGKKKLMCKHYGNQMDLLEQHHKFSLVNHQLEKKQKHQQLIAAAIKGRQDTIKIIEGRMTELAIVKRANREALHMELKAGMEAEWKRKKQRNEEAVLEDLKLQQEVLMREAEVERKMEEVRLQLENKHKKVIEEAEKREIISDWKIRRLELNSPRRRIITKKWGANDGLSQLVGTEDNIELNGINIDSDVAITSPVSSGENFDGDMMMVSQGSAMSTSSDSPIVEDMKFGDVEYMQKSSRQVPSYMKSSIKSMMCMDQSTDLTNVKIPFPSVFSCKEISKTQPLYQSGILATHQEVRENILNREQHINYNVLSDIRNCHVPGLDNVTDVNRNFGVADADLWGNEIVKKTVLNLSEDISERNVRSNEFNKEDPRTRHMVAAGKRKIDAEETGNSLSQFQSFKRTTRLSTATVLRDSRFNHTVGDNFNFASEVDSKGKSSLQLDIRIAREGPVENKLNFMNKPHVVNSDYFVNANENVLQTNMQSTAELMKVSTLSLPSLNLPSLCSSSLDTPMRRVFANAEAEFMIKDFVPGISVAMEEITCFPEYFVRSIELHLNYQMDLVNKSLISHLLVNEKLLSHFEALQSLILLQDGSFAKALTYSLFAHDNIGSFSTILNPTDLNGILSRALTESGWNLNPLSNNVSFVLIGDDHEDVDQATLLDHLSVEYKVTWPVCVILDQQTLSAYSRLWKFIAQVNHAVWSMDELQRCCSSLNRTKSCDKLVSSHQFHLIGIYRLEMTHFIRGLHSYISGQVLHLNANNLDRKLQSEILSLDYLYDEHCFFVSTLLARCFLGTTSKPLYQLLMKLLSLLVTFHAQFFCMYIVQESEAHKLGFLDLQATHDEFRSYVKFLHSFLLMRSSHHCQHSKDLLARLDFNFFYTKIRS